MEDLDVKLREFAVFWADYITELEIKLDWLPFVEFAQHRHKARCEFLSKAKKFLPHPRIEAILSIFFDEKEIKNEGVGLRILQAIMPKNVTNEISLGT